MRYFYMSEAMQIGKTYWRLGIGEANIGDRVRTCTQYQWRDQHGNWRPASDWPRYNPNDTYNGLPRGLEKLYKLEQQKVDLLIHGKTPRQQSFDFF